MNCGKTVRLNPTNTNSVRSGNLRRIAEYARGVVFGNGNAYTLVGSLSRDGKSIATTVLKFTADLWILEGFPQPQRPWF